MEGIQWKAFYHTMTSLYVVIERCARETCSRVYPNNVVNQHSTKIVALFY